MLIRKRRFPLVTVFNHSEFGRLGMDCWLLLLLFIGLTGSIRIIISPQTAFADVWSLYPGAGRRCLKLPSTALIGRIETFFICICRCWKMLQCSL